MTAEQLARMRSVLFVPADRPERFAKALASGADGVIIDLEDAVAPASKASARASLSKWLIEAPDCSVLVRVNSFGTNDYRADLEVGRASRVAAILLPKAETAEAVAAAHTAVGKPIWPIIESAKGLANATSIASAPGVNRLCLGTIDLALDMELDTTSPGASIFMDQARFEVAVASKVAGIAAPIDGVHPRIDDASGLQAAARHASGFGFTGMLAIHPRQPSLINAAFAPSSDEAAWAEAVLAEAASNPGAFSFRGMMIDAPVLARARRIKARAERHSGG